MEMLLQRVSQFLQKSPEERRATMRFFTRMGLSKLPYAPIHIRLTIPPSDQVSFWWSYVTPYGDVGRSLLEYWGEDIGELRFLWRVLEPGMTFLDIGAYHGLYTLVAAKKLGGRGRLVAFEPSARERRRLRLHLRFNRITHVAVEPFALSSYSGQAKLFTVLTGHTTMNSLSRPPIDCPIREVAVETRALDHYVDRRGLRRVDLIKIDTEGGELEAFRGSQRVLAEFRPVIICELLDWVTRPWGYAAREIVQRLRECDYEWFDFRPDGSLFPHQPQQEYPDIKNYLAVPREKRAVIDPWVRI
jgi:FkbM family methyltransferase